MIFFAYSDEDKEFYFTNCASFGLIWLCYLMKLKENQKLWVLIFIKFVHGEVKIRRVDLDQLSGWTPCDGAEGAMLGMWTLIWLWPPEVRVLSHEPKRKSKFSFGLHGQRWRLRETLLRHLGSSPPALHGWNQLEKLVTRLEQILVSY